MDALPRTAAGAAWLLLLAVAGTELVTHATVRARVPSERDWAEASAFVRARWREGDLAVAAPRWADPLLRLHLRGLLSLRDAGRSDLAGYRRLWSISQRGHRPEEAPPGPPQLRRRFGQLLVERWALRTPELRFDFVEAVEEARVARWDPRRGRELPCAWRRLGVGGFGGLYRGPHPPARRAVCPGGDWVGATVLEDVDLRLRRCVHQPPSPTPLRVRFEQVPLEEGQIVVYAGLDHHDEREGSGPPVTLRLLQDGEEIGRMVHRDGEGWKRMVARPRSGRPRGAISFVVEGARPPGRRRAFCWAASVQLEPTGGSTGGTP